MIKTNEPCPMCGNIKYEYQEQLEQKQWENDMMTAFLVGRKSSRLFSRRENEVFDAFYCLEIRDFGEVAKILCIAPHTVEVYYDRAMEKFTKRVRKMRNQKPGPEILK